MRFLPHVVAAVWLFCPLLVTAAPRPLAESISSKERAQGFSDRVVLAKPKVGPDDQVAGQEAMDGTRVRDAMPRLGGIRVIEVDAHETVDAAIARLAASGRYEFVERDYLSSSQALPNDPAFHSQWSLRNTAGTMAGSDIGAVAAWDIVHDASRVLVAVIDSGIAMDPDLVPNLWVNPAPTFGDVHGAQVIGGKWSADIRDENGHGTRVASIIGAVGNNGIGMSGVAWRVQLMILKHAGEDGMSFASDTARAIDYAIAHNASIINCSFGNGSFSETMWVAIQAARKAGVTIVAAAGNDSRSIDLSPFYPAGYLSDNVIAVGNSTDTDAVNQSSNTGFLVELFAPGTSTPTLDHRGDINPVHRSGTSLSAPHVAGALALLRARYPTEYHYQLINRVLRTVDFKPSLAGKSLTNGRLNVRRALEPGSNQPFNDNFAQRGVIAGQRLGLRANNADATTEPGEPSHGANPASKTLWWHWVPISTGMVSIDTAGSAIDTTMAVFTGSELAALTTVAVNDDTGASPTSRVAFRAVQGVSYAIAVSSKTGTSGYIQLNVTPGPTNDIFAQAASLIGDNPRAETRNDAASTEPGEPAILGTSPSATLWYKWIAPRAGRFQVSAFTFDFDPLLAVYTGTSLANLALVAANDNTGVDPGNGLDNTDSRCTINTTAGTTYYFQIDAKSAARGMVYLTVTDSLWQFTTDSNTLQAPPAIGLDGTLYLGTQHPDRRVYAIAPDGSFKWSHQASDSLGYAGPVIGTNGCIYFGTRDGKVTALTSGGEVRWQRKISDKTVAHAIAVAGDGTLYVQSHDGYLRALNPVDGGIKWQFAVGTAQTSSGAIIGADGTIYQPSDDGFLYAVKPEGTLKWKTNLGGTAWESPALDQHGNVYVVVYNTSELVSLDASGTRRWSYRGVTTEQSMVGSPALNATGDTVYVGAADDALHAVDATNGRVRWKCRTGEALWKSSPAVDSNGVIYVGGWDGKLYAITPNGTVKRTWETAQPLRASPIIHGTSLYLAGSDAKLYAFDIGAYVAAGPWPQFRHNVRGTGRASISAPVVMTSPGSRAVTLGSSVTFTANGAGDGPVTYQWQRNGSNLPGATAAAWSVKDVQPSATGLYHARISAGSSGTATAAAILGVTSSVKLVGVGTEYADIVHPGTGATYDQILLQAGAAAMKADPGQILRISFIDLNNDIVQVELAGAGTLAIVLDAVSGPASPVNYNQAITYMKGHAGIVLTGADETTHLSVFSVGRANATNEALFKPDANYDGFADLAFIAIMSTDGKFGGLRTANASYFATKGLTGIYAPGVEFLGPVFIGDIQAADDATGVLVLGRGNDVRVTGGDLHQLNGRAVQVAGVPHLQFAPGSNSHGRVFSAQRNLGQLEESGADVTTRIVANP
jgi:outer membrane protein assembly factor BamB/subtilisin family serine protease